MGFSDDTRVDPCISRWPNRQTKASRPDRVVIGSAKYVQWNGKTLPRAGNAPAVEIALSETDVGQRGLSDGSVTSNAAMFTDAAT